MVGIRITIHHGLPGRGALHRSSASVTPAPSAKARYSISQDGHLPRARLRPGLLRHFLDLLALLPLDDRMVASIGIVAMSYGDGSGPNRKAVRTAQAGRPKLRRYGGGDRDFPSHPGSSGLLHVSERIVPGSTYTSTRCSAFGLAAVVGLFVSWWRCSPGEYDNLSYPSPRRPWCC